MTINHPVIPFDLEKAKKGYPVVTVDGTRVTDFHHFAALQTDYNCAAVVKGHLLSYNTLGLRPRKYWNSPDCLDLRIVDIMAPAEPTNDFLII